MSSKDNVPKDFMDMENEIIYTFCFSKSPTPNERRCVGCKFYSTDKCKRRKLNSIAPFIGVHNCYRDMSFKQRMLVRLATTCIIVNED